MLTAICSAKGSPGVSSLALAIAAKWPDGGATLLEADPTGTDLSYRCRHQSGREVASAPSLLGLATAVRRVQLDSPADPGVLDEHAQPLACGARLVPGVPAPAQARGLSSLWGQIAHSAAGSASDVVVDLGRLERTSATMPLAATATALVVLCQPQLESVIHLKDVLSEVAPALGVRHGGRTIIPAVVGPAKQGAADAADVDQVLGSIGIPLARTIPIAYDPAALAAVEGGGNPHGRLARTHLLRSVTVLVTFLDRLGRRETAPVSPWEVGPRS